MRTAVLMIVFGLLIGSLAVGGVDEKKTEYQERAAKLSTDDANGHYVLGLWCSKSGLDAEARLEFEKVVALNADHEGARHALGYVRHQNRWLSHGEAMRAKGFVRHEGTWLLKEEVASRLLPATEKQRKADAQVKVRKFLKKMVAGGAKAFFEGLADSIQELRFYLSFIPVVGPIIGTKTRRSRFGEPVRSDDQQDDHKCKRCNDRHLYEHFISKSIFGYWQASQMVRALKTANMSSEEIIRSALQTVVQ